MRRLALLALPLLFSCAPIVCPEADSFRQSSLLATAPDSYQANLSLRYGLIRVPLQVRKKEGRFTIESQGSELSFDRLCMAGVCFDLPMSPDGVLFGKVLRGNEKVECSAAGVIFQTEGGPLSSRYIFREGKLSLVEFFDSKRSTTLRLNYLDWAKEGYARAIKVETENFNLLLTVDSLKF